MSGWDDFASQFAEAGLPQSGRSWKPTQEGPGASLIGEFIGLRNETTTHGTYPVVTLRLDETEEIVAVWMFWQPLRCQFTGAAPQLGTKVGIKYREHVTKTDGGKGYHTFDVLAQEPVEGDHHDSRACMGQHNDEHDVFFDSIIAEIRQAASDDEENQEGDWKPFD